MSTTFLIKRIGTKKSLNLVTLILGEMLNAPPKYKGTPSNRVATTPRSLQCPPTMGICFLIKLKISKCSPCLAGQLHASGQYYMVKH